MGVRWNANATWRAAWSTLAPKLEANVRAKTTSLAESARGANPDFLATPIASSVNVRPQLNAMRRRVKKCPESHSTNFNVSFQVSAFALHT